MIVSRLVAKRRTDDPLSVLTPREREVLELMAAGNSNQGIADTMVISLACRREVRVQRVHQAGPPVDR